MSERKSPYEAIGGIDKVDELVDRFYDLMALERGLAELRAMHPPDLSDSREKLKFFLTGWMGGPDVYPPQIWPPYAQSKAPTLQDWHKRAQSVASVHVQSHGRLWHYGGSGHTTGGSLSQDS